MCFSMSTMIFMVISYHTLASSLNRMVRRTPSTDRARTGGVRASQAQPGPSVAVGPDQRGPVGQTRTRPGRNHVSSGKIRATTRQAGPVSVRPRVWAGQGQRLASRSEWTMTPSDQPGSVVAKSGQGQGRASQAQLKPVRATMRSGQVWTSQDQPKPAWAKAW